MHHMGCMASPEPYMVPYVVHASTKPVLSEPSTLRQAQGEWWVEALSTNGISIGYPALRGIHPEP